MCKEQVGICEFCDTPIYNLGPDFSRCLDGASYIKRADFNSIQIIGGYGSTVSDMSIGAFINKKLYNKVSKVLPLNHECDTRNKTTLYICDTCLKKFVNEKKVILTETLSDDIIAAMYKHSRNDYYVSRNINVAAYLFPELIKRFKNDKSSTIVTPECLFKYNSLTNEIYIIRNDKEHDTLRNNEAVIFYSYNDYEKISIEKFHKRFTFFGKYE